MSSVVKVFLILVSVLAMHAAQSRDMRILALQEGGVACKNDLMNDMENIYQIGPDGQEVAVASNFEWSDCNDGAVLMPLGEELIKSGLADRVIFLPVGVEGGGVEDWQDGGRAIEKLKLALTKANANNTRFDYVFWQGNMVSADVAPNEYQQSISKVLKSVKLQTNADKFIISSSVNCQANDTPRKTTLRWDPLYNRFSGPDLQALGGDYRADHCNFNQRGYKKMAHLWVQSISEAETLSQRYQKESVLYYFKKKYKTLFN
jgi:hypothetical protein